MESAIESSSGKKLCHASFKISDYVLPKFEIFVEDSLYFTIRVFVWMLMDDHELYTKYQKSILNVTFSKFIVDLAQLQLCNGIQTPDPVNALCSKNL